MYRILIACVFAIQVQGRPFFFVRPPPLQYNPWLLPSQASEPGIGAIGTVRLHQSAYFPFSQLLNRQTPVPSNYGRFYGRIETQPPFGYPASSVYQPSPPPLVIPSNEYNPAEQVPNVQREYGSPNGPQPVPVYATSAPAFGTPGPAFGTPAPAFGAPTPAYGPPQTFGVPQNLPSNTFVPFNRFEPSAYQLPNQQFGPPFQPVNGGSQLPVAPFSTNVLPLIPSTNLPGGPAYLPPVYQQDSTLKMNPSTSTTPTTFDSEINANELATRTESTKLPTFIRDGTQTTQEETSVSIKTNESVSTESSSVESTSPLSTTQQSSDSTIESSSSTSGSTVTDSTNESTYVSDSTANLSSTTMESSSTDSSSAEPSTDNEISAN